MKDEQVRHAGGRNWRRMLFKTNKVWAALDKYGRLLVENGKVLIKYRLDQDYQYKVNLKNLAPLEAAGPKQSDRQEYSTGAKSSKSNFPPSDQAVHVYTDGACSGNPGPAGIGVVLLYQDRQKEISRYIGRGTNNIAELRAIEEGLKAITNRNLPVVVFTDSNYAYGLLAKGWKAKENQELVNRIRKLTASFRNLRFKKVKGHSGCLLNEKADRLAVQAVHKAAQHR